MMTTEGLGKSAQCAQLLCDDIRKTHRHAVNERHFVVADALQELIGAAATLAQRLALLADSYQQDQEAQL